MINPIDIRQHAFSRSFRGYDPEEVKAFLNNLAREWQELQEKNGELKREVDRLEVSLKQYKEMESMLHKTLQQAENSSATVLENAKKEAENMVGQAEQQSNEILQKAYQERSRIEQEVNDLINRRNDILNQLKMFMRSQLERLDSFEANESMRLYNQAPPAGFQAEHQYQHHLGEASPAPETEASTPSTPASNKGTSAASTPASSSEAAPTPQRRRQEQPAAAQGSSTPTASAPSRPTPAGDAIQSQGAGQPAAASSGNQEASEQKLRQQQRSFFDDALSGQKDELVDDILNEL
jgi:cell division initiation protein